MNRAGMGIQGVSAFLLTAVLVAICDGSPDSSWYVGCYYGNVTSTPPLGGMADSPATCGAICRNAGQGYIAIGGDHQCYCVQSVPVDGNHTSLTGCNNSCNTSSESLHLPCGGAVRRPDHRDVALVSVYRTEGPYLHHVTAHVTAPRVYSHRPFSVAINVTYAGLPKMSLGIPDVVDGLQTKVEIEVQVAEKKRKSFLTATGTTLLDTHLLNLTGPGIYTIDVRVSNTISDVSTSVNVTVEVPVPTEVELSLLTPEASRPSCVPSNTAITGQGKVPAVFMNEVTHFRASADAGYMLTFHWSIGEAVPKSACADSACISSTLNYTFVSEDQHNVTVTVSSGNVSVSDKLHVIVVRQELTNVTFALENDADLLVTPSRAVRFVVSMVTTQRQNTTLEVDFGDGEEVKEESIDDQHGRYLGGPEAAPGQILLGADYGEGCLLRLTLQHYYKRQGEFSVSTTVRLNTMTITAHLPEPIVVQERIRGLRVQGRHIAFVDEAVMYVAEFSSRPTGVTFNWTVLAPGGQELEAVSSQSASYALTFTTRGTFVVRLWAGNRINFDQVRFSVSVHDPIRDLRLTLKDGGQAVIRTGDTTSFLASVSSGSNVQFDWGFSELTDGPVSIENVDNMTSVLHHTFNVSGTYTIVVRAYNLHDSRNATLSELVDVQDPIETLRVTTSSPTLLGRSVQVTATVTEGSDVQFKLDYNGTTVDRLGDLAAYTASWSLQLGQGETLVRVTASNLVSNVSREVLAIVQRPVEKVTLTTSVDSVIGEKAVFLARLGPQDKFSSRTDLVYTWTENDRIVAHTRAPVLQRVYEKGVASVHVGVNVSNKVDSQFKKHLFSVNNSSNNARFTQGAIQEFGKPVNFTIISLPSDCERLKVNYHLGDSKQLEDIEIAPGQRTASWSKEYGAPGIYIVDVTILLHGPSSKDVQNVVVLQERLAGLELVGPTEVPLYGMSPEHTLEVKHMAGSHILYEWSVNDRLVAITPDEKLRWRFEEAGTYNVTVRVSNTLSAHNLTRTVLVQYPIGRFDVTAEPSLLGRPATLVLTVHGGPMSTLSVDFGDGSGVQLLQASQLKPEQLARAARGQHGPTIIYRLTHDYTSVGSFRADINVSNAVSARRNRKVVLIEEPITDVVLTAKQGPIVELGTEVVVLATVQTGRNLTFDWIIQNAGLGFVEHEVESNGTSSRASFEVDRVGMYNVSVLVSYAVNINTYVYGNLDHLLQVVQAISDLRLVGPNEYSAARLQPRGNRSEATATFVAICEKGSGVTFVFDFGDGHTYTSVGKRDHIDSVRAQVTHVYTAEGVYPVSVTASNPLGNVTATIAEFYIQFPPQDCRLVQGQPFNVPYGEDFLVNVTCRSGSDIMFDWSMGDQTQFKNRGPSVRHRYRRPDRYQFVVRCYNLVGEVRLEALVGVVTRILDVTVTVEGAQLYHSNMRSIIFIATVRSEQEEEEHGARFTWDFGELNGRPEDGNARTAHIFKHPGRYLVHVIAVNAVSRRRSAPLLVEIVEPITRLQLSHRGDALTGRPLVFEVYHYEGSNVTYHWDFGDHHKVVTTQQNISHNYTRVGKYVVSVLAENHLSNRSASMQVFVLNEPCRPPDVDLLQVASVKVRTVTRGQELKIETAVKINCSITAVTLYSWTLQERDSLRHVQPSGLSKEALKKVLGDPILFLPRYSLDHGNYTIGLKVEMKGTSVHTERSISVQVKPAPLLAVIKGGLMRTVQRTDTVVMDASASHDPDYPNATDITFNWICYKLIKPGTSCFANSSEVRLATKSAVLRLPGNTFNSTYDEFVFNLTISRPGLPDSKAATQVVEMTKRETIDVTLLCAECEDGIINSDQRFVVEAQLPPGYQASGVQFKWTLFKLDHGEDNLPAVLYDSHKCVNADGTTHNPPENFKQGNDTAEGSTYPNSNTISQSNVSVTSSTSADDIGNTLSTTAKTTTSVSPAPGPPPDLLGQQPSEDSGFFNLEEATAQRGSISEGHSGSRHSSGGSGREPGAAEPHEGGQPSGGGGGGSARDPGPTEGHGSRRGAGSGSSQGVGSPDQGGTNTGERGPGVDPATDTKIKQRALPHIVSQLRREVLLSPGNTTTGIDKQALVIRPGVLHQGRMYVVKCLVKHPESGREGEALVYVRVNQNPIKGRCYLRPSEGLEMDTVFKVICLEWNDTDLPIRYEVSYSVDKGKSRDIIYQGLNYQTTFQLPAGDMASNGTVLVSIAILDQLGARTTVCSLPVKVKPVHLGTTQVEEERVLNELQTYVSKGDNRNARLHTRLVAHWLNRNHGYGNASQTALRAKIRTTMLETLKELPMRDEYEVQQTTSAVAANTAVTKELEPDSLRFATEILAKATQQIALISDIAKRVQSDVVTVAIQGASNIVAAASRVNGSDESATKQVVEQSRWSIHNLTQVELNHTVLGEDPKEHITPHLVTYAGRFRTSVVPEVQTSDANFVLPNSLSDFLEGKVKDASQGAQPNQTQDCYEMHVVTYQNNPFHYGQGREQNVASKVASLTLFKCGGPEMSIQKLPDRDQVSMAINHLPKQGHKEPTTFELHKHQMQVHKIEVDLNPLDERPFHIVLDLEPVSEGRLFPIALLLRPGSHPTPDKYQYKEVFPASAKKLNLFLPASVLDESIEYYLGVVDAHFNAARPRPGEVRQRRYTLSIWRRRCIFWDELSDSWSNEGCSVQASSTLTSTDCRCNHLTAFGANYSLVPNDLAFTQNVEEFFDLNENPVTFILVICLLALYIVLLVLCIMADNHDQRKGALVHLVDNMPSHCHCYAITLETGMRRGAGTSARVSLVLHGKEGMSETRELLSESGQPLFERNSRDTFIMTLPASLGHIWKVQVWHNNAGNSPNWYLSGVMVKDINKGNNYYFSCEKWFAVEEEDGKVEREIMVMDNGLGFAKVLWAKGTQYLTDYHLWFSMLVRPSYSRFTRAQRLTCCLALALSYMAVNAAWYRSAHPEYRGEFGLVDLSWRSVAVGFITALLVIPVNLLLVFIFRRSKIKKVCVEDPPEKKYYPVKRDSVMSLDSTVRLLQPAMTPSIFDQSMLHWQSLQEWAQRQWTKRYQQEEDEDQNQQQQHPPSHRPHHHHQPLNQEQTHIHRPLQNVQEVTESLEELERQATDDVPVQERRQEQTTVLQDDPQPSQHTALPPGQANLFTKRDYETDQTSSGFEDCLVANTTLESSSPLPPLPSSNTRRRGTDVGIKRASEDSALRRQQELDKFVLESIRSQKPRRLFLPAACRYVGWVLGVMIIIVSGTITVLYGFRFGRAKSIMWLQSLFFSLIQCIFVTHPLLVLIISVYTAIKYRNDLSIFDHHDDGVIEQRTAAQKQAPPPRPDSNEDISLAMGIAVRQRSRYLRFARPPQEKQLIAARKTTMKQKKAVSVLRETVGVIALLLLLLIVAYAKDINTPYRLNSVLKDLMTKTGNTPFSKIQSVQEWYKWSQSDLLDSIYWETWYNGQRTNHEQSYVGNSVVVGTISVRQLRVQPDSCQTPDPYRLRAVCYPHYGYDVHDEQPFGVNGTWRYYGSDVTRATGMAGKHAHYDGGGYQVILPETRRDAYTLMKSLETEGFIDRHSRAIVVELSLYSAPTNLFSSVSLLLELPPSGGASTMSRVSSAHLFRYTSSFDYFVLACELLLMVAALYKLHCEIGELALLQKAYLRQPWKALEAALVLLLLAFIACFVYRFVLVHEVVELLRASYHEEYIDISYIAYWDEILRSFLGFIILIVTVQALRLFRNRKLFAKFGGVYRKAGMEILCLAVILLTWVCAYTCLGYALYGSVSHNFRQVDAAFTSILGLLTGQQALGELQIIDRIGSQIFLISFLLFAVGSLTAYIVAVLTFHYRVYQEEGLPSLSTKEMLVYLWEQLRQFSIRPKPKNKGEDASDHTALPAEFTMAEIEYQVDEMLFKMNALTGASGLPEKPAVYFTDSDCISDGISSGGGSDLMMRPFDEDRLEQRVQKIEGNIIGNDPHLAKLLELDAIGANVLTQEREKQLTSVLEFQILRQLQLQRRGSADVQSLPSDNGQVVIHRLSSLSGSTTSSDPASSSHSSPVNNTVRSKSREHLCRTKTEMDVLSVRSRSSRDAPSLSSVAALRTSRPQSGSSRQSLAVSEALVLQDVSEYGSSSTEDAIPLQDMSRPRGTAPNSSGNSDQVASRATGGGSAASSGSAKPGTAETRLVEDPVSTSSCSSGGAEVRYIVSQGQSVPVQGHATTDDAGSVGKTSNKGSAKVKAGGSLSDKQSLPGFEFLYTDTSSGSEQDGASRSTSRTASKAATRAAYKARSLRKTKSRGKGKGRGRLTVAGPAEGVDELGIDNKGYTSESDMEAGGEGREAKPRVKQGWT